MHAIAMPMTMYVAWQCNARTQMQCTHVHSTHCLGTDQRTRTEGAFPVVTQKESPDKSREGALRDIFHK
jgi:hypothetical protein